MANHGVLLSIMKTGSVSTLSISSMRSKPRYFLGLVLRAPKGMKIEELFDQSRVRSRAISGVLREGSSRLV